MSVIEFFKFELSSKIFLEYMTVNDKETEKLEEKAGKAKKKRIRFASQLEHHQFPKSFWADSEPVTRGLRNFFE